MSQKKWKKKRKTGVIENKLVNEVKIIRVFEMVRKNWIFLALVSLLTVAVFANGMAADFVSDDYASITQNPDVGNFGVMGKGLNPPTILNYLTFKIFGHASSVPYHLLSLVIYLGCLWLVFGFVYRIYESVLLARLTTLIFSLMPVHVEAVTWISGRLYLLLAIFILLAFELMCKYLESKNWKWLVLALLSFGIAFLTDKPRPFSLFLIVILYFFYVGFRSLKINWPRFMVVIAVLAVLFMAIALPQINQRVTSVNSGYNASESIFYDPFFQYPTGLTKYFQLMWVPIDLTLYHTMFVLPVWLNWAIFLTYLVAVGYFYFKDKRYFFALGLILAGILPSMAPLKVSWLVAERYLFLGSLGFAILLGLILLEIWKRWQLVSVSILALLVTLGSVRIYFRNIDWQTNHNLWVNTCQVSPNSHNAWNNIGDDYDKLKDYENAVKGFTQSTVVKPNYADAFHNRANILFKMGRLDLARDSYNTAIYFSPTLYQTYISLTQIDLMEGKINEALAHATKAAELQPGNPQPLYVLAAVYAQAGRAGEAAELLKKILSVYPNYQPARQMLDGLVQKK